MCYPLLDQCRVAAEVGSKMKRPTTTNQCLVFFFLIRDKEAPVNTLRPTYIITDVYDDKYQDMFHLSFLDLVFLLNFHLLCVSVLVLPLFSPFTGQLHMHSGGEPEH